MLDGTVLNVDTSAGIAAILPHQSHRIIHQSSSITAIINRRTLYFFGLLLHQ
jgi:hypothetical protein